jgi:TolB-like protein/Flp pilus assembly protein TadD
MILAFRDTELDLRQGELRRAGTPVHVEPQVFDLLVFLIRNRDRIVSKDEILDAVWNGRIVSEAALSSRINAARKALGDNGNDQAVIRTFHKRGFRFVAETEERAQGTAGGTAPSEQRDGAEASRTASSSLGLSEARAAGHMPSVAVLPLVNVTGDPEHEYFAYGLTEDIIRLLGRNRGLRVLTRHTTAAYRGLDVDVREVGAALGVRYVVEGSVRKIGDDVRITAELASAVDGRQLWSEAYEFNLPQIFDVQESMARQIAAVVEPELATVEQELASRKAPASLDAWDCYQRAFWHLWGFTTPGFDEAEAMFRRAIELEPGLPRAHAGLSYVLLQKTFHGSTPQRRAELLGEAMAAARTSVGLDERDPLCRCVLGRVYCLRQQYADAVVELEATIANSPSFAQGYFALAFTLVWCGRAEEAIPLLETACELSPRDPHLWAFHQTRAFAHMALGELESAEFFARQACRHPNAPAWPHATLTSVLGLVGKEGEATAAFQAVESRRTGYRQASARDDLFFCGDQAFIERYVEGLRRAGVPE